ncbi:MAG: NUDIX domain-containing protein [Pseudomonadota bacterium]
MRRYGERIVPGVRYRTRPGAYGVILDRPGGNHLLLAATPAAGEELLLPGGGVDPGEGLLPALHREVMEETGWRIRPLQRLGAFQRYCYMSNYGQWGHKICHVFLCTAGRSVAAPSEADHQPVWLPLAEAAVRLSVSGERAFVARLLSARTRRAAERA